MSKILCEVHSERLEIVSLKKDIEQLKLKYTAFKKDTESIRKVFQKLIEDLKYKCDQLIYFGCLQRVTSKRYFFPYLCTRN